MQKGYVLNCFLPCAKMRRGCTKMSASVLNKTPLTKVIGYDNLLITKKNEEAVRILR